MNQIRSEISNLHHHKNLSSPKRSQAAYFSSSFQSILCKALQNINNTKKNCQIVKQSRDMNNKEQQLDQRNIVEFNKCSMSSSDNLVFFNVSNVNDVNTARKQQNFIKQQYRKKNKSGSFDVRKLKINSNRLNVLNKSKIFSKQRVANFMTEIKLPRYNQHKYEAQEQLNSGKILSGTGQSKMSKMQKFSTSYIRYQAHNQQSFSRVRLCKNKNKQHIKLLNKFTVYNQCDKQQDKRIQVKQIQKQKHERIQKYKNSSIYRVKTEKAYQIRKTSLSDDFTLNPW